VRRSLCEIAIRFTLPEWRWTESGAVGGDRPVASRRSADLEVVRSGPVRPARLASARHNAPMRYVAIALIALGVAGVVAAVVLVSADEPTPPRMGGRASAPAPSEPPCPDGRPPRPRVDRVDEDRAFALLRRQVELGPRPAGSPASRRLAEYVRRQLPNGRLDPVPERGPDGRPLVNVVGAVQGRDRVRIAIVGAHYDTKDLPGFVGANDGAGGTAAVVELARSIRPRQLGATVVFVLFDGEESRPGRRRESSRSMGCGGAAPPPASTRGRRRRSCSTSSPTATSRSRASATRRRTCGRSFAPPPTGSGSAAPSQTARAPRSPTTTSPSAGEASPRSA
jgi:Peptidase family M28